MAREWTIGALGDDLDLVLDAAMRILTPKTIPLGRRAVLPVG